MTPSPPLLIHLTAQVPLAFLPFITSILLDTRWNLLVKYPHIFIHVEYSYDMFVMIMRKNLGCLRLFAFSLIYMTESINKAHTLYVSFHRYFLVWSKWLLLQDQMFSIDFFISLITYWKMISSYKFWTLKLSMNVIFNSLKVIFFVEKTAYIKDLEKSWL